MALPAVPGTGWTPNNQDRVPRTASCPDHPMSSSGPRRRPCATDRTPTSPGTDPPRARSGSGRLVGVADLSETREELAVGGEPLLALDPDAGLSGRGWDGVAARVRRVL